MFREYMCNARMFTFTKKYHWICIIAVSTFLLGCTQQTESEREVSQQPRKVGGENAGHGDEIWGTNLENAITKAKASNKHVFVDFTGSDWCPPCMALHDKVLTQKVFLDYAKDNMELVMLDFPRRKQQSAEQKAYNQGLSKKHNIEGFPTVIVFDGDGKEVHRAVGFSGQAAAGYVVSLKKALNQ